MDHFITGFEHLLVSYLTSGLMVDCVGIYPIKLCQQKRGVQNYRKNLGQIFGNKLWTWDLLRFPRPSPRYHLKIIVKIKGKHSIFHIHWLLLLVIFIF